MQIKHYKQCLKISHWHKIIYLSAHENKISWVVMVQIIKNIKRRKNEMNDLVLCPNCNRTYDEDELFFEESSGNSLCQECFDSRNFYCEGCNEYFPDNQNSGNNYCGDCFDSRFYICANCDDITPQNEGSTVEGDSWCESCMSDANYCEECGEYYSESHFNDGRYHSCNTNEGLREHDYKPEPIFYGSGNLFYGVELEVESDGNRNSTIESLSNFNQFIYNKKDGSLSDNYGFEIVSHPATLSYHQNNNWQDILSKLRSKGCKSHDTSTCGLHIHMSREGIDEGHLKRFILFWYTQNNIVRAIARRNFNNYCLDKDMGSKVVPSNEILRSRTRYEQINLQNEMTVEVRRFKGTLNYVSFMACLELVDAVRKYTKTTTYKDMRNVEFTEQTFIGFVFKFKSTYPNLVQKLQQKIKFVATDSE